MICLPTRLIVCYPVLKYAFHRDFYFSCCLVFTVSERKAKIDLKSSLEEHCLDPRVNPFYKRTLFYAVENITAKLPYGLCIFVKIYSGQPHEKKQIIDIDFYFHFHFFLSEFSGASWILRDVVLLFPIGCRGLVMVSWIPEDD